MTIYWPSQAYQPQLDVRFVDGVVPSWAAQLVRGTPPNSPCWQVVMPRRGRKSWLAAAVHRARTVARQPSLVVDLRNALSVQKAGVGFLLAEVPASTPDGVLIIDEPGSAVQKSGVTRFVQGLSALREAGAVPVLFLTPGEHEMLADHLGSEAGKDIILPPALSSDEVDRMAGRAPQWGPALVAGVRNLDPSWLCSPFLVELLLYLAEQQPVMRDDLPGLVRAAAELAEDEHQYVDQLLHNGLSGRQRAHLRKAHWKAAGIELPAGTSPSLLYKTTLPADPVIERHLPEVLRIHHISDLHHGGWLRENVDEKDKSGAGRIIARLTGAGTPLDSYLAHVRQLKDRDQAPHLVIATGDIVNRPQDEFGEAALQWLDGLKGLLVPHPDLGPNDPRVVLVGGNHDVSWDRILDKDSQARHAWFATTFADYPHADLHLRAAAERRLAVRYPGAGLRLLLLGSAESGGEPLSDDDRRMLAEFQEKLAEADDADDEREIRELLHDIERIDPGVVSREILNRIGQEAGMLTIAAIHHPVSPVPSVEVAPYSGVVNAGQTKRMLASAHTALVLHGHTHQSFFAAERIINTSPRWTMRIAGAASLAAATADEQNGYNQVLVAREGGTHRIAVRQMRLAGGEWAGRQTFAFHPGEADECSLDQLGLDAGVAAV